MKNILSCFALIALLFNLNGFGWGILFYRFALVADNDVEYKYDHIWKSFIKFGALFQSDPRNSSSLFRLYWEGTMELNTTHIHANDRSVEFSELISYHNRLYAFCDRSGMMWEITDSLNIRPVHILFGMNGARYDTKPASKFPLPDHSEKFGKKFNKPDTNEKKNFVQNVKKMFNDTQLPLSFFQFPSVSLKIDDNPTGGNISTQEMLKCAPYFDPDKQSSLPSPVCPIKWNEIPAAQKTEWALVKDGLLYVGSTGREWVQADNTVKHYDMEWVNIIDLKSPESSLPPAAPPPTADYRVRHLNFSLPYRYLREITNSLYPGYLLHESAEWLEKERLWVFLPKHQSHLGYTSEGDECHGSNIMIVANEDFSLIASTTLGAKEKGWGVGSFRFLRVPAPAPGAGAGAGGKNGEEGKGEEKERLLLLQVRTTERSALQRLGANGKALPPLDSKLGLFDVRTGRSLLECPAATDPLAVPISTYANVRIINESASDKTIVPIDGSESKKKEGEDEKGGKTYVDEVVWRTTLSVSGCTNDKEVNGAEDYEDYELYGKNKACYISTNDAYKYEGLYFLSGTSLAHVYPK